MYVHVADSKFVDHVYGNGAIGRESSQENRIPVAASGRELGGRGEHNLCCAGATLAQGCFRSPERAVGIVVSRDHCGDLVVWHRACGRWAVVLTG